MTLSMATEDLYDATAYICAAYAGRRSFADRDVRVERRGHHGADGRVLALQRDPLTAGKFTQDFSYAGVNRHLLEPYAIAGQPGWARDPRRCCFSTATPTAHVGPYGAIGVDGVWLFGSKSNCRRPRAAQGSATAFYSVAETNTSMAWRPMTENARRDRLVSRKAGLQTAAAGDRRPHHRRSMRPQFEGFR